MTVLVEDVLDRIIQYCPTTTISIVSRLSHSLRRLALPHLLRSVCLDQSSMQVVGFLDFIIDNGPESDMDLGRHVFELEIVTESYAFERQSYDGEYFVAHLERYRVSSWAPMLTQALMLMPNLRSFGLKGSTDKIVAHSPDFGHTLQSRPLLTSLTLWGAGYQTTLSFSNLSGDSTTRCSLRQLEIQAPEDFSDASEEYEEFRTSVTAVDPDDGIGTLLVNHSGTVKELYLDALDLMSFLDPYPDYDDSRGYPSAAFPSVTKLTISDCWISLDALAVAFPMLQTLCLKSADFLRLNSSGFQNRGGPITFRSLASIEGSDQEIYAILKRNKHPEHVRRLVITYYRNRDGVYNFPFALSGISPTLKSLRFKLISIEPISWWKRLSGSLPSLIYLHLTLYSSSDMEWKLICSDIPAALSTSPIHYLSVIIQGYEQVTYTPELLALSISKAIPTLKYLDVCTLFRQDTHPTTWWKVVRAENPIVSIEQISCEEGNRLRDYYDWTFELDA